MAGAGALIPAAALPWAALAIVAAMFALFVTERWPVEVVALSGASAMLILGILPFEAALGALANPAPWTIAALFVVMGALSRTGALDWAIGVVERLAGGRALPTILALLVLTAVISAFANNTPVVVMLIPVFVSIAGKLGTPASKLLIPLSYVAIMGGMTTLIGTSTNLLVDGVAREAGLAAFTIFEITPLALILLVWGAIYLALVGRHLLPERESMAELLSGRGRMKFFTEVAIPEESGLIGRPVQEVELFRREGVRLIDVLRGDASLRRELEEVTLEAGDRVVLRTEMAEVLSLRESRHVRQIDTLSSVRTTTVEALISPGCRMVGRSLGTLRLRRRYGVYPLAVHRRNQNIGRGLDDVIVRVGDTLLLEGTPEDIRRLAADMALIDISAPTERAYRRGHAPMALAVMGGIVALAALGVAPILALAVVGVALLLVTGCIDSDEAFAQVDAQLLVLIFSMLAVGAGLQNTGAAALIVEAARPALSGLPPFVLVWAVFLLTAVLTELVTNNAVAVLVTPVVISLAQSLGVDPRGLVVAVMVAASSSFSTPIGYQTNTLVYGPGGYRFTDFMKVGIPLNLSIGLLASALIPVFWPL